MLSFSSHLLSADAWQGPPLVSASATGVRGKHRLVYQWNKSVAVSTSIAACVADCCWQSVRATQRQTLQSQYARDDSSRAGKLCLCLQRFCRLSEDVRAIGCDFRKMSLVALQEQNNMDQSGWNFKKKKSIIYKLYSVLISWSILLTVWNHSHPKCLQKQQKCMDTTATLTAGSESGSTSCAGSFNWSQ